MVIERLPNGNLLVPMRAESEESTIGDAMVEIGPDHPDYAKWDLWLKKNPSHETPRESTNPAK